MDYTVRKKVIIILSIFTLLLTIVSLLWMFFSQTTADTRYKNRYTDPYTGEVVDKTRTGGDGQQKTEETNDIVFLGVEKLLSYGMLSQQINSFKGYIYQYSEKRTKENESKITEMTIDFSTYKQKIDKNSTGSEFTVILNRDDKLKYTVVNTYPTVSTITTKIYKGDLKVFDSTQIKFDNNERPI